MLARHWEADERASLSKDKEIYSHTLARIAELQAKATLNHDELTELEKLQESLEPKYPPIPSSWESRYVEVVGKPYVGSHYTRECVKPLESSSNKEDQTQEPQTSVLAPSSPDIEIKKEPDLAEMPVLEDERLFRYNEGKSFRSRNSSQASLDSFRSRNDSGASSKKGLRVSLTNVLSLPSLKKELLETGSVHSSISRPQSAASSPEPVSFVGLKFNRTTSGRWSATLKRDLEDGESLGDEMTVTSDSAGPASEWKKMRISPSFGGSDSDDDFTLADVGGEEAVRSMMEREDNDTDNHVGDDDDDEEDDDDEDDDDVPADMRFYSQQANLFGGGSGVGRGGSTDSLRSSRVGTPGSEEPGDNDSVQNAINSILDMPDRGGMQTPDDLNNLTGLLDSIEEEDPDPNLDAAVKSIQGLF